MVECPHCRAPLRDDLRFCTSCGARIDPGEDRSSPAAAPWLDHDAATSTGRRRTIAVGVLAGVVLFAVLAILWSVRPHGSHHPTPSSLGAAPSIAAPFDTGSTTPTDTGSTTPTDTEATTTADVVTRISDMDRLLDARSSTRADVGSSVQAIGDCTDPQGAEDNLNNDAAARDELVSRLRALEVTDVPNGQFLVSELSDAWSASASSDRSYARWAANLVAGGVCAASTSAPHDSDWEAAQVSDVKAQGYKSSFVDAWNPLAAEYDLAARDPDQL